MSLTKEIYETIEQLKQTDINGCITGSSMTGADFDLWEQHPDIDLFVYKKEQLLYASDLAIMTMGFEPKNEGEKLKLKWMRDGSFSKKCPVSTIKLVKGDVELNISHKKYRSGLLEVLASFDMSIIMIGYDIPRHITLDLRCGWEGMIVADEKNKWSDSPTKAVPNPLRLVEPNVFSTSTAVRQFDRVIKYWNRGFDTRPMAEFYLGLIDQVIEQGAMFQTEASVKVYDDFVNEFTEMRDKIQRWLDDKNERMS